MEIFWEFNGLQIVLELFIILWYTLTTNRYI